MLVSTFWPTKYGAPVLRLQIPKIKSWTGLTWQQILSRRRPHAYETTGITEASSPESLISRWSVIVECQRCSARCEWNAQSVAGEGQRFATGTQLTAFNIVQGIDLFVFQLKDTRSPCIKIVSSWMAMQMLTRRLLPSGTNWSDWWGRWTTQFPANNMKQNCRVCNYQFRKRKKKTRRSTKNYPCHFITISGSLQLIMHIVWRGLGPVSVLRGGTRWMCARQTVK